jgi:polyhydroxyalkanoate synthase subunit PhaC
MHSTHPLPTLPLHLAMSLGCWLTSPFVLRCAKSGLLPSNLQEVLDANLPQLQKAKGAKSLQQLENALQLEIQERAAELVSGVVRYCQTPSPSRTSSAPVLWQLGNARLLDYGALSATPATGPVVLFVPSLINRYYVLDLEPERSLLRFMRDEGCYPLVLDWGAPGKHEENFNTSDYIEQVLLAAINFITQRSASPIVLAGYCMGGILSLAAAQLAATQIQALALFATPWNFHCEAFSPFLLNEAWTQELEHYISQQDQLSADVVQMLFSVTDPFLFEHKFRRFSSMEPSSRTARDFVALEQWVNDGVPMTRGVARDCLVGWAQRNELMQSKWQVRGKAISPSKLDMPTFIAMPKYDHVVPTDCASPLLAQLPQAQIITPGTGHVGMMVGSRAKRECWQPFSDWLHAL